MSKEKTVFVCQGCGSFSPKWIGKCPDCGEYNTFVEENVHRDQERARWIFSSQKPLPIVSVQPLETQRFTTGIDEFDRVLGGGVVAGSLVLIGGEPGIGKSTLLLQAAGNLGGAGSRVLLVSGEESIQQIKMRAERLGAVTDNLYLLSEIAIDRIKQRIEEVAPQFVIIDSIQTLYHPEVSSAPGSVSQVRECSGELMRLAKSSGIPIFIVGHVTKDGSIAGPRLLEHMVDTVLYFEGSNFNSYRLVRATKNRYGATNELAIFEMNEGGLAGVSDPSRMLLAERPEGSSGSVVVATMEGTRPLLVEVQALLTASYISIPRRLTSGVDSNRALLTMAVLERRAGIHLEREDIYINVVGGVRVVEPALDLGLALAIVSAHRDQPLDSGLVVFGEIGLAGEVRYAAHHEARVKEAVKLGFNQIILPFLDADTIKAPKNVRLHPVKTLQEAIGQVS